MEREKPPAEESVDDVRQRQRIIGHEIRKLYEETVSEEMPERLLALLQQLDDQRRADDRARTK